MLGGSVFAARGRGYGQCGRPAAPPPALRPTLCGCYKSGMGTRGSCCRVTDCRRAAARGRGVRVALIMSSLTLLPTLAGCSSFSSPPASSASTNPPPPYQAAGMPPPPYSGAPAGRPADDVGAAAYPYPKESLVELFQGSTESPPPAQNVPRPPSTYTASAQPYTPAAQPYGAGQPGYVAPAGATPNPGAMPATAAPPATPTAGAEAFPYPKQSLFDVFSNKAGSQ
jgi:hypothetical protein